MVSAASPGSDPEWTLRRSSGYSTAAPDGKAASGALGSAGTHVPAGESGRGIGMPARRNAARLRAWMLRRGYSRRTVDLYCGFIRRFDEAAIAQGLMTAESARIEQVQDYALTLKPTYATRAGLQNAMRALWRMQGRPVEPLRDLAIPRKPPMTCRAVAADATTQILAAARRRGVHQYAAVCLMYYAGLRAHETAGARWDWVRNDELCVVGKGGRTRWLPIHDTLADAIAGLPRRGEWLLPGRAPSGPVSTETVRQWVRLVGASVGLDLTPHMLRHTTLATMLDSVGDLRAVAEFAGHSFASLQITAGYTRTTRARKEMLIATL